MVFINITRWPAVLVFLLAGSSAVAFAFVTVNLFTQAMASVRFMREFGWEAILHGALWQVAQLLVWGSLALGCWLAFKACEQELKDRYFAWARNRHDASKAVLGNEPGEDTDA